MLHGRGWVVGVTCTRGEPECQAIGTRMVYLYLKTLDKQPPVVKARLKLWDFRCA